MSSCSQLHKACNATHIHQESYNSRRKQLQETKYVLHCSCYNIQGITSYDKLVYFLRHFLQILECCISDVPGVMVAKLTAQLWSSPFNTGPSFITSFGISSHSSAETLTVPTRVTSTRVSHARIKVWTRVNLEHTIVYCLAK